MCLKSCKGFRYSKKDIVCYKVLDRCPIEWVEEYGYRYMTPYHSYWVPDNAIDGNELFKAVGKGVIRLMDDAIEVDEGYIHTFVNKEDAIKLLKYLGIDREVFECVIPAGVRHIKGKFNGKESYASKAIKFIKKIC